MMTTPSPTSAWPQNGVATEVSDLHHHAVVENAVGGLEATVHLNVTGVEVRHALSTIHKGKYGESFPLSYHKM